MEIFHGIEIVFGFLVNFPKGIQRFCLGTGKNLLEKGFELLSSHSRRKKLQAHGKLFRMSVHEYASLFVFADDCIVQPCRSATEIICFEIIRGRTTRKLELTFFEKRTGLPCRDATIHQKIHTNLHVCFLACILPTT
jgi:hypothetical protein